ncbi:sugar phosphate isomerase/epimerase family protein [Dictyobacter aurantiacus]|uniref:Myo-inositol catabolism protein IolH n=1 Tax=Dictyobacter aurantiacus TaxID=1936993 RepID=A0A401Z773_9CHLR|nr:sugar phosphate isomerase/epimerase family protein [Dictyobacter aurantiacus]GCE02720.1 myo-inositol catabolism protein IolH [Dictyobacter aurantiacus]
MNTQVAHTERIAAFPKCFMDELCVSRSLTLFQWIEMAAGLGVDGLEFYPGFFTSFERPYLTEVRTALQKHRLAMPMLCASPDFTQPDQAARKAEIENSKRMIELVDFFAASEPRTCRVLSGQRRPGVSEEQGIEMVVDSIQQLLPYAQEHGVILAIENHYKDNYWTYPEFAQHLPLFTRIVYAIDSPWFGVNYDPSNAILAGENPLDVLDAVKERVVSMHASDRRLQPGYTLEDLRAQEEGPGYASILCHGEIGTGLNDFSRIFQTLKEVGFHGWISIEDGVNGLDELQRSVHFLRQALAILR